MKTVYVQRRDSNGVETVDEFSYNTKEERAEAKRCLSEYRMSDPSADHYISSRACRSWYNKETDADTIHEAMKETGAEIGNHEMDLHVRVTPETTEIVKGYKYPKQINKFKSNIDGSQWYEIPFAFKK